MSDSSQSGSQIVVTAEDIESAKTDAGGWTREQLAAWGVPWPPPRGWKRKLIKDAIQEGQP